MGYSYQTNGSFKRETSDRYEYECNHDSSDFDINYSKGGPIHYRGEKRDVNNITKPNTYQVWDNSQQALRENLSEEKKNTRKGINIFLVLILIYFGMELLGFLFRVFNLL